VLTKFLNPKNDLAYDELNRFSWTVEEMRAYDSVDMKQAADRAVLRAAKEEGHKEGREEGREEGIQETLLFLLKQKFKTVPEHYHQKVGQTNPELLRKWMVRVLECLTIDEVFTE